VPFLTAQSVLVGPGWAGEGQYPPAPGRPQQDVAEVPWPKLVWLDLPLGDLWVRPWAPVWSQLGAQQQALALVTLRPGVLLLSWAPEVAEP